MKDKFLRFFANLRTILPTKEIESKECTHHCNGGCKLFSKYVDGADVRCNGKDYNCVGFREREID